MGPTNLGPTNLGPTNTFALESPESFAPVYPARTPVPASNAPLAILGALFLTLVAISFTLVTACLTPFLAPGPIALFKATLPSLSAGATPFARSFNALPIPSFKISNCS